MSSAGQTIMLVDDDPTIVETLTYNLKRHGFGVVSFNNGRMALAKFDEAGPDLVILDWMLPDMVGPEICKLMRSRSQEVPILMLTGRSSPADVAHGLQSGADDYLAKPFSAIELLARVQALLRRAAKGQRVQGARIDLGFLSLDDEAKLVILEGKTIDLSPREFALLKVFMKNAGKTLPTETLLNQVWGVDFQGDVKTVAVHIRWLRQKMEADPKNPKILETVHRSGYRLNLPAATRSTGISHADTHRSEMHQSESHQPESPQAGSHQRQETELT